MEINRIGNMDLSYEEKEHLFNMSVDDAIKLMTTFDKWKWSVGKSINAMGWMMAALLESGDVRSEERRVGKECRL